MRAWFNRRRSWDEKRKRCARAGEPLSFFPWKKMHAAARRMIVCLARIAAWVGDNDLACEQLVRASRLPSSVSYGDLKLMPWWDPLRGNPCFEKIVASLAPK